MQTPSKDIMAEAAFAAAKETLEKIIQEHGDITLDQAIEILKREEFNRKNGLPPPGPEYEVIRGGDLNFSRNKRPQKVPTRRERCIPQPCTPRPRTGEWG
jgi:hypothetical protein